MPAAELPALTVANVNLWRQWLAREGATAKGVWLTIAKKDISKPTSLTYPEALDEALCYGWIDSRGRTLDDSTQTYRFTPRAPKGMWSKRNIGFVERLLQEGRMQPAGLATVESAKADGRWDAAYSGGATAEAPQYFLDAVKEDPAAQETWDQLNRGNRYAIYMRLVSLKTEAGREKRTKAFVEMLANGETLVPQKGMKTTAAKVVKTTAADVMKKKPTAEVMEKKPAAKVMKKKKPTARASNRKVSDDVQGPMVTATSSRTTRSGRQAPSYTGQG